MTEQETLYAIALSRVPSMNLLNLRLLMDEMGSATAIYENRKDLRQILPAAHQRTLDALAAMDQHIPRAEQEWAFAQNGQIQCIGIHDTTYPLRLRECPDAPILLYYRGRADLNAQHIISIVGTRQITEYGKDICHQFVRELQSFCPDALIISGLAYGVDIHSHRAALKQGLDTVAVLAHGLDQIYPRMHRDTAVEMLQQGGLLTEFMSQTNAEKKNFVQRNRIVAGMADATIVVESAQKGGSLITAEIAAEYGRDVFAFPGRIGDKMSAGCNQLIRTNRAGLISDAKDLMEQMGWVADAERQQQMKNGIQECLFQELTTEEEIIVSALQKVDSRHVNLLSIDTGLSIPKLSGLLFNLEMKGIVKLLSGGMYRLCIQPS